MKRLVLAFLAVGFSVSVARAEVQTVAINNFSSYGNGEACYVDPMFYGSFNAIYRTLKDQDPTHTNKGAAVLILNFFELSLHGRCDDLNSGSIKLDTPDDGTFVVVVLSDGGNGRTATKTYWSIVPIDGASRSHITVNAV